MYKPRYLAFKELLELYNWQIKVYTISKQEMVNHHDYYNSVLKKLPEWLAIENGFDSNHDFVGFLILHAGTEGIFSLINWWVGQNMLNTYIYLSKYNNLDRFELISGKGLSPCVWELAIINHERIAWTNNMLKPKIPNKKGYLYDVIGKDSFYF